MKTKRTIIVLALLIGAVITLVYLVGWHKQMYLGAPQYCVAGFFGAIVPTLTTVSILSKRRQYGSSYD
jgi:hypothetical protein